MAVTIKITKNTGTTTTIKVGDNNTTIQEVNK